VKLHNTTIRTVLLTIIYPVPSLYISPRCQSVLDDVVRAKKPFVWDTSPKSGLGGSCTVTRQDCNGSDSILILIASAHVVETSVMSP